MESALCTDQRTVAATACCLKPEDCNHQALELRILEFHPMTKCPILAYCCERYYTRSMTMKNAIKISGLLVIAAAILAGCSTEPKTSDERAELL